MHFRFTLGKDKSIRDWSRNFWLNEIFGRKFDFVLGEHKLTGDRIIEIFEWKKFLTNFSSLY